MDEQIFEVIEHTADWSIRVKGSDLAALFTNAALGMSTLMAGDLNGTPLNVNRQIDLTADDVEGLLVDWLSELAYLAEMEQIVFSHFDILEIAPTKIKAHIQGGIAEELHKHIKAVTYHNLQVVNRDGSWETTVVFDV